MKSSDKQQRVRFDLFPNISAGRGALLRHLF